MGNQRVLSMKFAQDQGSEIGSLCLLVVKNAPGSVAEGIEILGGDLGRAGRVSLPESSRLSLFRSHPQFNHRP